LIGTLYPLLLESVTGEKISVGAPFFDLTFGPLMIPLLIAVPFGPILAWKRGDLWAVAQRLFYALGAALLAVLSVLVFVDAKAVFAALGVGLAIWLVAGSATDIALKAGLGTTSLTSSFARLRGLPRSVFGTAFAHAGLGVTVFGIVMVTSFEQETIANMKPGDTAEIAGYTITFDALTPAQGPNFTEEQGHFSVVSADGDWASKLMSAKRHYPARQMPTTEAGIESHGFSQLYV
jgi:cytochrome c-type biogenesis protein CcmF